LWFTILKDTYSIRREIEKKKKAHKNSDDDIIGSVRKILTKRVQRYQERSSMVTGVGHISGPKVSEPQHFWTARVANFVHHLWPYLMSLDSSHRDIFNNTNVVIIRTSVCLNDLFFLLFSLSLLSLHKLQGGDRREKEIKKKNVLGSTPKFRYDTIDTIGKTSD